MSSLLDTSVVSQRVKETPDARVVRWFQLMPDTEMFLSVISLQEIRAGVELMAQGRKRDRLEQWLVRDLRGSFTGRLLLVDDRVADEAGRISAKAKKAGAEPELADALIAATAIVHGLKVATLNRNILSCWVWNWWSFDFRRERIKGGHIRRENAQRNHGAGKELGD